jgi:hypothetical protein
MGHGAFYSFAGIARSRFFDSLRCGPLTDEMRKAGLPETAVKRRIQTGAAKLLKTRRKIRTTELPVISLVLVKLKAFD